MSQNRITIETGNALKTELRETLWAAKNKLANLFYADLRVNISDGQSAFAQNGMLKGSGRDSSLELSVRAIAGEKMKAPGYYGISLGPTDIPNFYNIVTDLLEKSYLLAMANAKNKEARTMSWGMLGKNLLNTALAPIEIHQKTVLPVYRVYPLDVPLQKIAETVLDISKEIKNSGTKVKMNYIGIGAWVEREIFASTDGSLIDQTFCYTQGIAYVVAQSEEGVSQEHYDYLGHQRGWEIIEEGIHGDYMDCPDFKTFSMNLARETCELTSCPSCPSTDKPVVVVTDPHYNALLSHEIVGHPTELDRILKMETSYAGRSWLFRNFAENMVGKKIGSEMLNAYSDPSLPGYGHYEFDHEGTPAKKIWHIRDGVLVGFMNSRQTAAIFRAEPNGHFKANGGQVVPLIRMSNTVFAQGHKDPAEIIREVEHGYYLVGHRTPSIAESRENFRISSRKVYEIRNGELGALYRNGGIMSDSRDYFINIDAVGNDFRLFPIPNCGKGQPMQTKRLGNGGPTMRSRAKLTGGAE